MIFPSHSKAVLFSFGIWCMLSDVLFAYDISTPLRPLGPLGVTLDYSLATAWPLDQEPSTGRERPRNWMWSSHLTFGQSVDAITDAQLWQIAIDAHGEMRADLAQYGIGKKNMPTVMTVMAYNDEIILASSQKGQVSFSYQYKNTRVLESLQLCQAVWAGAADTHTDQPHRNKGSCGEVMAAQLYYSVTENHLSQFNPRVGSVAIDKSLPAGSPPVPLAPCGGDGTVVSRNQAT